MAYLDTYMLARDPQLTQRLVAAVAQQCTNVWVEAPTTPNHDVRVALVAYAGPRLVDFERFAEEVALLLCVLNPTLGIATPDAELVTALEAVWTAYALIMQAKGLISVAAVA